MKPNFYFALLGWLFLVASFWFETSLQKVAALIIANIWIAASLVYKG